MLSDGLNTFEDFINAYPKYKKFADNEVAQNIFNHLSKLDNIQEMIKASIVRKPALSACIYEVDKLFSNQKIFNYTEDDFSRQALGAMVKIILKPFGYEPEVQRNMPSNISTYIKSAMVYKYNNAPILQLEQKLAVKRISDETNRKD